MSHRSDWKRRLSIIWQMTVKTALQAIRPCRESETGWTSGAQPLPGNHSSLVLNERGPGTESFLDPARNGIGRLKKREEKDKHEEAVIKRKEPRKRAASSWR